MSKLDEFNDYDFINDDMDVDDYDGYESFDEDFDENGEVIVYRARRSGYYCHNCEKGFIYPVVKFTTQAKLFGVESLPNDERIEVKYCPYCRSDEIEEFKNE